MLDSKGRIAPNIVSHFKRASNHNTTRRQLLGALLFHISKEHQITTIGCLYIQMINCFTFQKSIKSQHAETDGEDGVIVSHFKRASNHNRLFAYKTIEKLFHISKEHQITTRFRCWQYALYCFTFQKSIKSQRASGAGNMHSIVSHFKRASNHNIFSAACLSLLLFHISKEHQITTCCYLKRRVYHCFTFQKSIKSQLGRVGQEKGDDCFTFQKSIKSQLFVLHGLRPPNCFTFQKSIKSQQATGCRAGAGIVSHFKRASNHNTIKTKKAKTAIVSHFKRASNHNNVDELRTALRLFHISKEHQITTSSIGFSARSLLFHISKEHQITTIPCAQDSWF